jgi:hypothetical protein
MTPRRAPVAMVRLRRFRLKELANPRLRVCEVQAVLWGAEREIIEGGGAVPGFSSVEEKQAET